MENNLRKNDLIYPELSYKIVGCAFEVFNDLGPGRLEKYYQAGMRIQLMEKELNFKEQVYHEIKFGEARIGTVYFDFMVDNKIIIEIKKDDRFLISNINQVNNYLRTSGLLLGILINFGKTDIKFKRIVNLK
jgi:GxxExxY protein